MRRVGGVNTGMGVRTQDGRMVPVRCPGTRLFVPGFHDGVLQQAMDLRSIKANRRRRFRPVQVPQGLGIAPMVVIAAVKPVSHLIHGSLDAQRQAQASNAATAAAAGNLTAFEYLKSRAASMPAPKHGFSTAMASLQSQGVTDGQRLLVPAWREPGGQALYDSPNSSGFSTVAPFGAPKPSGAPAGWIAPQQPPTGPSIMQQKPRPHGPSIWESMQQAVALLPPAGLPGADTSAAAAAPSPVAPQQLSFQAGSVAGLGGGLMPLALMAGAGLLLMSFMGKRR